VTDLTDCCRRPLAGAAGTESATRQVPQAVHRHEYVRQSMTARSQRSNSSRCGQPGDDAAPLWVRSAAVEAAAVPAAAEVEAAGCRTTLR